MPEIATADLTLHHAPNTRSGTILILLEELGVDYKLAVVDHKSGGTRKPEYLAINPMGKVPALMHKGQLITESPAICLYLADTFPAAGLAPAIGDPLRGPYLRWMVFYGSCFEPAIVDRALKRTTEPAAMSPYGDYDTMLRTITGQLARGPYLLGDRFTAADVLWGSGLTWTTRFKLVPELPEIAAYLARIGSRPSVAHSQARDAEIAAALGY